MKPRLILTIALAAAALVRPAALTPDAGDDPPTLVIVGTGINASIGGSHARTDQMLYHTLQMFGAGSRGMRPTSVRFEGNGAQFSASLPTVENGRITGSRREELGYPAAHGNRDDMLQAAQLVASEAAKHPQSIVAMDMDLPGIGVVAGKSVTSIGAMAANFVRRTIPGATAAEELTLTATGSTELPHDFRRSVDAIETSWNRETARAAVFMEAAAREFKARHGAHARVILVGHSAFTDAIDQVPMKDGGAPLIDLRVLSSERTRPPRERDPERTIFIAHGRDLPPTQMGNPLSPALQGDLKDQGTVVTLKGYSYAGWDDSPIVLGAEALAGVSGTARLVARLADEARAITAHTATHLYTSTFDMEVCSGGRCVDYRGKPSDIVALQARGPEGGASRATQSLMQNLEAQKPNESPVGGGISLTKPATLPIDPSDVASVQVDGQRLVLALWSGERLRLPPVDAGVLAAAVKCVYGQGRGPELSLDNATLDTRAVYSVRYVCSDIARTPLGTLMLEADRTLGQMAWGPDGSFTRFEGHQPYPELTLDDDRVDTGALSGRVWLVPSVVRLAREGDELIVSEIVQAINFEFWKPADTAAYLEGAKVGIRTPAGDYLGARLTREVNDNPERYPPLQRGLRDVTAIVGTLLWARAGGVAAGEDLLASAEMAIATARAEYQLPSELEEITREEGMYHVLAAPAQQTVTAPRTRPAVVFGPHGPTRYLWADGGESRLGYADGRLTTLTSRHGHVTRLLYDASGALQAIAGPGGAGIAVIPRNGFAILAAGVGVDADTRRITIPETAAFAVEASPADFLDGRIAQWLAMERANENSVAWLTFAVPIRPADESWGWTPWMVGGLALIALVWMRRASIRSRLWRRTLVNRPADAGTAVAALARTDDPQAPEALRQYVAAGSWERSTEAIASLQTAATPAAREALIALVPHPIFGTRAAAALDAIDGAWRTTPEALALVPGLERQIAGEGVPRHDAAMALGRLRAREAIPAILPLLADQFASVAAGIALSAMGKPAIQPVLELLGEQGDARRKAVWETLDGIPGWEATPEARAAVPALLAGTRHKYSLIRQDCVRALGRIGDPRALHALTDALDDLKPRVSDEAVEALGLLGDRRAIPRLRKLHAATQSLAAAAALARLGEQSPAILSQVVGTGAAADAGQVLDTLAAMDEDVLLSPEMLGALLRRLTSEDYATRSKAFDALQALPARWRKERTAVAFAKDLIERSPDGAAGTLAVFGQAIEPQLVARLKKGYSAVAIDRLLDLESPAGPQVFRKYLDGRDTYRTGRMMTAMAEHGDTGSLEALLDATAVDEICRGAVRALETILERRAHSAGEPVLRRAAALADRDWTEYIPYTGPCNFEGETYSHRLDCGRVRQLARQELLRRGLDA